MKKLIYIIALVLFFVNTAQSQNVAINTDGSNANSDAILHLKSTSKGLLIPSMTTTQRTSISNVSDGLMVYDTETNSFWFRDSGTWNEIVSGDIDLSTIEDENGDTKIQVEEGNDDDQIRFDIDGTEQLVFRESTNGDFMMEFNPIAKNIFMGSNAGKSVLSDGINNTFLGQESGKVTNTGDDNTFLGYYTGTVNTTGSGNTYLGSLAGQSNTAGNSNTFIGELAGGGQPSGNNNTYVGNNAGGAKTGGVNNTIIGYQAGMNSASTSANVFIGYQAGMNETGGSKLYIDKSSTSTPLIYGDFAADELEFNGAVGIGRTPATNDLEVEGTASKSSSGDWLANSDARLKKDINPLSPEAILQKMLQLQGLTYEWNDDKTGTKRPDGIQYGFTAQNIKEVFPELVTEDNLGYLQTAYGTYDAMYVEAIRALLQKIEKLESKMVMLENKGVQTVSK